MLKPVILITVHRRYFELKRNLVKICDRAKEELGVMPEVVVVWAKPEPGRAYILKGLQKQGLIQHLLKREALAGEVGGCGTTVPESHNIRLGLEFIKRTYGDQCYAIMNTADVCPLPGYFGNIVREMNGEAKAFVCFLNNGCCHDHIWHTNTFAVCMDERYWPPLAKWGDQDILERMWGLSLQRQQLEGVARWSNPNGRWFSHLHESESQEPEPYWYPWYERFWRWLVY